MFDDPEALVACVVRDLAYSGAKGESLMMLFHVRYHLSELKITNLLVTVDASRPDGDHAGVGCGHIMPTCEPASTN